MARKPSTPAAAHLGARGGVVAEEGIKHGGGDLGGACGWGEEDV